VTTGWETLKLEALTVATPVTFSVVMALLTAVAKLETVRPVASCWEALAAWASFVMVAVNPTVADRRVDTAEAIVVDALIVPLTVISRTSAYANSYVVLMVPV